MGPGEGRLRESGLGESLLTAREAAEYLGYHYGSIRRLAHERILRPAQRAGRTMLFRQSDLERYRSSKMGPATFRSRDGFLENPPRTKKQPYPTAELQEIVSGKLRRIRTYASFTWRMMPRIESRVQTMTGRRFRLVIRDSKGIRAIILFEKRGRPASNHWLVG